MTPNDASLASPEKAVNKLAHIWFIEKERQKLKLFKHNSGEDGNPNTLFSNLALRRLGSDSSSDTIGSCRKID